ncbi:MAG: YggU family protein [Syntrophaceae bacterium]|nr:YggU family protein [Syntrophaceae bacterium]
MVEIKEAKEGATFAIHVTPRASRAQIIGIQEGMLKIKVTAQPHEGEANSACVEFLAKELNLKKSQIEIVAGFKSRKKTVLVKNKTKKNLETILNKYKTG